MHAYLKWRLGTLAPFAVAAAFAFLLTPPPPGATALAEWIVSLVLVLLVAGFALVAPRTRLPDWAALPPALVYLASVALLREAGGGNDSGVGPMVLLPVIYLALHGSRRVLAATLVAVPLVYWVPLVVSDADRYPSSGWRIGALLAVLSIVLGVTVQRLHQREQRHARRLRTLAHTDELTGLPNRRAWDRALDAALSSARRRGEALCIAAIDLDRFKTVNDSQGHGAGDELLVDLARAWAGCLRGEDTLARTGGDEFAVTLPNCTLDGAEAVLERMRAAMGDATCSIGLCEWDGIEDPATLTRRADMALYAAKHGGRNRIVRDESRGTGRPALAPLG